MVYEPFLSSRLKIERAKRHISELNSENYEFLSRKPYKVITKDAPNAGQCSGIISVREKVTVHLPLIIGDAVHNLRSSLDLLACDLVRLNGQSAENVYFPFCLKRDNFEATIKKRHIDRAAPEVVDIIRTLDPYEGGFFNLRAIHDLDITDKHIQIIPIYHCVNIPYSSFADHFPSDTNWFTVLSTPTERVKDGMELFYTAITDQIKVNQDLNIAFDIAFADGQPLERQPIIPTLFQFVSAVEGIIKMFEPFWHPI